MAILWTVETDLLPTAAEQITGMHGWGQGGRLGTEAALGHADAVKAAAGLQAAGHKAWISPNTGTHPIREARDGLAAYATARAGIVEAIHAGLEVGMGKSEMARLSGLSRPGLDKIIDRFGLDRLVRGE